MSVAAFQTLIDDLAVYFENSKKIGGVVAEQADAFKKALELERDFIAKAVSQKKPSNEEQQALLSPVSEAMGKVSEFESKYRGKEHVNHLKTISEGAPALGWVCVEPTPGPFVKETIGASQFWSNKILREFKGKDDSQVAWVNNFTEFLQNLAKYILQYHTTGVAWNSGGGAAPAAAAGAVPSSGNAERELKDIIDEHLSIYFTESDKLGGVVQDQAKLFKTAVQLELELVAKAAGSKKPTPEEFQILIQPISELMGKIGELESKYRGKDFVNHLKTVAEGTQSLGWVCVEPTPGPFIKETVGSSEFWSNKILKDFKGKDETHVNWVKGFNGFLKALVPYVSTNHTTGLSWNTLKAGPSSAATPAPAAGGSEQAFKDLIVEYLVPFVTASQQIGGEVATQAQLFKEAADKSAELVGKAAKQKKPSPDNLGTFLAPVSELMSKIGDVESKYRGKEFVNHLKTVAEGTPALGWLAVEPTPGPYAKEMIGASEFWSNKILREFKGKDEKHVNWVNSFSGFLKALPVYIATYHTTGLSWSK